MKRILQPLEKGLEEAVHRQLMSDVPYGVLLSGGLDSSIISAVKLLLNMPKEFESGDEQKRGILDLHSFAVGLEGSPDLLALKSSRTHRFCTPRNSFYGTRRNRRCKGVIYHLETYDVTTVRASTPMYLMSRVIKSMGIKMVLSGGKEVDRAFRRIFVFPQSAKCKKNSTMKPLKTRENFTFMIV